MKNLWRRITSKVETKMGQSASSAKKAAVIENAEKIQIDSSPLHCPVCLLVFPSTPQVLPCGHTFCKKCLDRMIEAATRSRPNTQTFECALCRTGCFVFVGRVRNFLVENILSSIETYEPPENVPESDVIATQKITIQRLKQMKSTLEDANRDLSKTIIEQHQIIRTLATVGGIIALGFLTYLIWFRT
ncbi:RING-type zinc-finger domain-containing protein [Ditylenchus destructor]|nr:RING-type zinc-finger domain-containing protein [Ditylenchus destructor]